MYVKDSAETEKNFKITAVCASSCTCALNAESTLKTSSTQVYVKTDQEPVEKNKERLANNCFNRFGSFTKCYASGLTVAPICNGSLRKSLFITMFKL